MGVPYLKMEGDQAYKVLDALIVFGNQQRDIIRNAYHEFRRTPDSVPASKIAEWQKIALDWANDAGTMLQNVFVSPSEFYEFRNAEPPFGATSANIQYFELVSTMKARIDKITEFRNNIRDRVELAVHLEVVQGNKIVQNGSFNSAKISE